MYSYSIYDCFLLLKTHVFWNLISLIILPLYRASGSMNCLSLTWKNEAVVGVYLIIMLAVASHPQIWFRSILGGSLLHFLVINLIFLSFWYHQPAYHYFCLQNISLILLIAPCSLLYLFCTVDCITWCLGSPNSDHQSSSKSSITLFDYLYQLLLHV